MTTLADIFPHVLSDVFADVFSHVCGQGRCFVVDGVALPLCQRCLGLYVGAGLTVLWLIAGRAWRRGLPPLWVLSLNVAMLLTAMLGGLHVIDVGPRWRMACGLWTGHVVALWLLTGAGQLRLARSHGPLSQQARTAWRAWHVAGALAAPPVLASLAWGFGALAPLGWTFWAVAAAAGVLCLLASLGAALAEVVRYAAHLARRRRLDAA